MKFIDEKYFKDENGNIVFIGPYMEAYIPAFYFEKKYAEELGDTIKTFGVFNIRTFNDPDGKNANPLRVMNIPLFLITYPSSFEVKSMDLLHNNEPEVYTVLKYYNKDVVCADSTTQNIQCFEIFLNVLLSGKLPKTLPYDAIFDIWAKNRELNGVSFDVSDTVYEMVISEIYRSRRSPVKRFGMELGENPNASPYNYRTASPREITKINSTFTGISFEYMDEMLTSGVVRAKEDKPENTSPMEEIMKY
jgi:hypothetical protein